jgi:hypothetical protein
MASILTLFTGDSFRLYESCALEGVGGFSWSRTVIYV